MANSVEKVIRAGFAFGKDPAVSNLTNLLLPLAAVAGELQGKTNEEIVAICTAGIDPLIGAEENALITGPDDPDSPVKIDVPLTDSDDQVLEFTSDLLLEVIGKQLLEKLDSDEPVVEDPPPVNPPTNEG